MTITKEEQYSVSLQFIEQRKFHFRRRMRIILIVVNRISGIFVDSVICRDITEELSLK